MQEGQVWRQSKRVHSSNPRAMDIHLAILVSGTRNLVFSDRANPLLLSLVLFSNALCGLYMLRGKLCETNALGFAVVQHLQWRLAWSSGVHASSPVGRGWTLGTTAGDPGIPPRRPQGIPSPSSSVPGLVLKWGGGSVREIQDQGVNKTKQHVFWKQKLRPGRRRIVTSRPHRQRITRSFYDIPNCAPVHIWSWNPSMAMVVHKRFSVNTTKNMCETHFGAL